MTDLVRAHLEALALRMGAFLRGFGDPAVHVGTPAAFVAEFMRLYDVPAIRMPGEASRVTFAAAVDRGVMHGIEPLAHDPVTVMASGLGGPTTLAWGTRTDLPVATLREDVQTLLATPLLRYYLVVRNQKTFLSALETVAKDRWPVAGPGDSGAHGCRRCGFALAPRAAGEPIVCSTCGTNHETFVPLPMASAIAAVVSFDALRAVTALDDVLTYQEEAPVVPLARPSTNGGRS